MELWNWILVGNGITGAVLNVLKRRTGFLFWIISNLGFVILGLAKNNSAQVALFSVYLILSCWGWFKWNRK